MVQRLLKIFNRELGSLHEAALLLALAMFLSQLLALFRDRLLAGTFGAGIALDIYYSAFRLPDLLYATIASFVSVTVLIPLLIDRLEKDKNESARNLLSAVFSLFILVMTLTIALFWFFLPNLINLLAPGFDLPEQQEIILLTRILLLSPFFLGLSNILGSVSQVYRRFLIYSLSPIFYNLGIILGLIFFVPVWGVTGLVWGVILGAFLHLAIQLPTIWSVGFWPSFSLVQIRDHFLVIKKIILISWPRTITLSLGQLIMLVFVALASYLGKGSIAIFTFAYNLQSVPLAIVGVSYSVAAFPALSKHFVRGELSKFSNKIISVARHIIFWSLPAIVMFIVLRAQIIRVILGTGQFNWTATRLVAACLALFTLSILAQSLSLLFVRGYYAMGKTARPLAVNLFSALITIGLVFIFYTWWQADLNFRAFWEIVLRVEDLPNTSVLVLPLAYSLGVIINCLCLGLFFFWENQLTLRLLGQTFNQAFWSALAGGMVSYYLLNLLAPYLPLRTVLGIFAQGLIAGLGGLMVNILLLSLWQNQELHDVWQAVRHRFWRSETLIPEQAEL